MKKFIPYDLIFKKREGGALSVEEIKFLVEEYTQGRLPDYQMAAFLMAVFFRKLNVEETTALTISMRDSGDSIDLSSLDRPTVDKHSTGGVGDKVSLCLAPLVASCGAIIPMMSGRGLGHTGGTLDKLEAIPGFTTALEPDRFLKILQKTGCAIIGQTERIAPADRKMYALRDVTATVDTMDLIAASILSKKFAEGTESLVLDVKTGSGAFMVQLEDSIALAELLVSICKHAGRKACALITDMDQPLGNKIGNGLEVEEAIEILRGEGPEDLKEITLSLGTRMLRLSGIEEDAEKARGLLTRAIDSGAGMEKWKEMVHAQGGDPDYKECPRSEFQAKVTASDTGKIVSFSCREVGISALMLGAGRLKSEDSVDPLSGIILQKKKGQSVETGEPIATLFAASQGQLEQGIARFENAFQISSEEIESNPLIYREVL